MGSPLALIEQYPDIVQYIESIETKIRIKWHPHLTERAPNIEIDDVHRLAIAAAAAADAAVVVEKDDNKNVGDDNDDVVNNKNNTTTTTTTVSLVHQGLKEFSLQLLPIDQSHFIHLTKLDVSNNELSTLPGLATLSNLQVLCIKRNWFNTLPCDIGTLKQLRIIDASRNFLKPNNDSLRFDDLKKSLSHLETLDVTLNQKCRTVDHRSFIQKSLLPQLDEIKVLVTIWQEKSNVEHNCIGSSAAHRDPTLLRSQLEPWGTVNLRRRLVRDFGMEPTDPKVVDRAGVMYLLLRCYYEEGMLELKKLGDDDEDVVVANTNNSDNDNGGNVNDVCSNEHLNLGIGKRHTIKIDGTPVREDLRNELLTELRDWRHNDKRGGSSNNRERPSINAKCYMILRAPAVVSPSNSSSGNNENNDDGTTVVTKVSRREKRRHKKMEGNVKLWNLALRAMKETDPEFATRCSEIAVTYGFTGSPHIDRQNASPFYGLALGEFTEGTGCVNVECSPRIVAEMNTKNRLGRVDGRWPHWVGGYDVEREERFSLIYYDTMSAYETPGPAIFKIPMEC
mmetsp:Transcript_25487/g.48637  ORF Transcript_25487/g.48637 Transcript_25487/m.48637 type:complete len:564 (-) Transcript_25487:118-1809(-)|eukprot:CAMPEP_0201665572 /NCGR_PEP_ID=MMETSP0494-20130426/6676_1 /ASSEMBLY_ACC=CAM_ASM_000839 /TAXON_ID=420259 /ORGANISM="Thalassiosira gravida, Strain GMp14c1" /LENGTH=563 /DNA_ID=CAMNT_0048144565 /DNA_START=837 /DNA_END=2528 /DNA_ORIENTATION=-